MDAFPEPAVRLELTLAALQVRCAASRAPLAIYPRQESNLVLDLRTVVCWPAHPEDESVPQPGVEPRPRASEARVIVHFTTRVTVQFGEKDSNLHKQLQRL